MRFTITFHLNVYATNYFMHTNLTYYFGLQNVYHKHLSSCQRRFVVIFVLFYSTLQTG